MTRPIRYLILATPRSGSTLLGQGLQATRLAGDPKEYFGHKMAYWMERWQSPGLADYAERLMRTRSSRNGVFGAKLHYRQLLHLEGVARDDPGFAQLPLADVLSSMFPNLHLIWATRDDKVRQAISWFKARQTGVWGQDSSTETVKLGRAWRFGDEPLQPGELAFDYAGIDALLHQAEEEDAAIGEILARLPFPSSRVVYEEFSGRYDASLKDLLTWMGIETPANLTIDKPRTIRLADDRTEEWVARFHELSRSVSPQRELES
ncbi:MAG: Stf0 family sulfotransferase [Thermomicrobiales bacterium]